MCDDLKRDFYAACPVWYWPVLWWQFVIMERYLARLYAGRGGTEMTYGLALSPHGRLRLIFVSDAARGTAAGRYTPTMPLFPKLRQMPINPLAEYPSCEFAIEATHAPPRAVLNTPHLYLDPG